ncbi:helix-turn-helix transcriptional regulator [Actinocorallia lasiicapitis]
MPVHTRDPLDARASHWHWLSAYMRWLRERDGLSLAQVGRILGVTRGTVCNFESGYRRLDEHYAKLLDERYETGELLQTMVFYARMTHDPDWARTVAAYELEAWVLKIYHGQIIPPPFSTEATIRAQVAAARTTLDVEEIVASRLGRKRALLDRDDAPSVYLLLDEAVLEQLTGGPQVLKAQLTHLLELDERPRVSIRVIPRTVGAHVGQDGPIRYVGLEARGVAYMGAQRGGRLVETSEEVRDVQLDWDMISHQALSQGDSRNMIVQKMESLS